MKLKIKRGSVVEVTTGSDKGKKGPVLEVNPKTLKIKVQGIRIQTRHDKKEGLKKEEGYIHYSNVKLLEQAKPKASEKKKVKATSKK